MRLNKGAKSQESGIRVQGALCSLIDNFTVLLFYFLKKKNTGTLEHLGKHCLCN